MVINKNAAIAGNLSSSRVFCRLETAQDKLKKVHAKLLLPIPSNSEVFTISRRLGIFCFKINTKINSEPLCVMGQITIDNRPVRSPCTLFLYCEMFYFFLSHIFGEEGIYILQA